MQTQILKEFVKKNVLTSSDLSRKLKISRQALHRHLQKLIQEQKIVKKGSSPKTTFYALNKKEVLKQFSQGQKRFKKRYKNTKLQEDQIYKEVLGQVPSISKLSQNGQRLFHYAFTEMVNNAIDHSHSSFIEVTVEHSSQELSFSVKDWGVGIYKNIQSKKKLRNELEAIQDLLKGKQTTLPKQHSGEGIFFTSKAADLFTIQSHQKKLIVNNTLPDVFILDIPFKKGTLVFFQLNSSSKKSLKDIFEKYTDEDFHFDKSEVIVKLFKEGEEYISRSQAKRLLHNLNQFKKIVLDFRDIDTIGQGFADEVFRIFASQYPDISISSIHCHENVEFMIKRAKQSSLPT